MWGKTLDSSNEVQVEKTTPAASSTAKNTSRAAHTQCEVAREEVGSYVGDIVHSKTGQGVSVAIKTEGSSECGKDRNSSRDIEQLPHCEETISDYPQKESNSSQDLVTMAATQGIANRHLDSVGVLDSISPVTGLPVLASKESYLTAATSHKDSPASVDPDIKPAVCLLKDKKRKSKVQSVISLLHCDIIGDQFWNDHPHILNIKESSLW